LLDLFITRPAGADEAVWTILVELAACSAGLTDAGFTCPLVNDTELTGLAADELV